MKSYLDKELRKYYLALLANLKVGGVSIPVVNLAKIGTKPPFIMILNQSQGEAQTKSNTSCFTEITVQCVTSATGDFGGDEFADNIADAVLEKLFATAGNYGGTDTIDVITASVTGSEMLRITTNTDLHIIRQLVINHFIEQKN